MAIKNNVKLRFGLPTKCQTAFLQDLIERRSFIPTENAVAGYVECDKKVLESTQNVEILYPRVRGLKNVGNKSAIFFVILHQRLFLRPFPNHHTS